VKSIRTTSAGAIEDSQEGQTVFRDPANFLEINLLALHVGKAHHSDSQLIHCSGKGLAQSG